MNATEHLHGRWVYACGHPAFECKCLNLETPSIHHRTDLCPECRGKLARRSTKPPPREPFPEATD